MIIYKATNQKNGKVYIGQTTVSLNRRKYVHNSKGSKTCISYAIKKYGKENFTWKVIEECNSKDELDEMEFHYIKQYHSHASEYGYNLTYGGDGASSGDLNVAKRPEVRKKLVEHRKHFNPMDDVIVKNRMIKTLTGRKITKEHRKNISKGMIGHKNSKGENSPLSKSFIIYKPDGEKMIIKGLRKFCRDNNLNRNLLRNKSHRGYRCEKI